MLVTVEQKEVKLIEVDVEFPCFTSTKTGLHLYKVISVTKAIQVMADSYVGASITMVNSGMCFSEGWKAITEEQYEEYLQEAVKLLTK